MGTLRVHTLSNGRRMTAFEVAEEAGINVVTARLRLHKTLEADEVLAPANLGSHERLFKVYTLSDGKDYTAAEIVKITGVSPGAIYGRLHKSRDAKVVLRPPHAKGCQVVKIDERMFFDPLGHWQLFNKCT
jgi:DNA-directed RNA polymerase specialized sigma24 family protein